MRLAYLGTPEAAVAPLRALVASGHDVAVVITRPDRRRGRGGALSASPVKQAALDLGLPVSHSVAALAEVSVDLGVVVAFGALIRPEVLERTPMVNVHFSLLPRWRGAAPVERAILAGDRETGVVIMGLEATLDTGPVYGTWRTPVGDKTATDLTAELSQHGAALLVETLATPGWEARGVAQSGEATYAEKLTPEDFRLTPELTAEQAARIVRLGRAWCEVNGKRLRILAGRPEGTATPAGALVERDEMVGLGCTDGTLWGAVVQPEGGRAMPAAAWWRGAHLSETRWS